MIQQCLPAFHPPITSLSFPLSWPLSFPPSLPFVCVNVSMCVHFNGGTEMHGHKCLGQLMPW